MKMNTKKRTAGRGLLYMVILSIALVGTLWSAVRTVEAATPVPGTISGSVLDTGVALKGSMLFLLPFPTPEYPARIREAMYTAVDIDGNYSFAGLPYGGYRVFPVKEGAALVSSETGKPYQYIVLNESAPGASGINFINAGECSSSNRTGTISGNAKVEGQPLGVMLFLLNTGERQDCKHRYTGVDALGDYSFTEVPFASYVVFPVLGGVEWTPPKRSVALNANTPLVDGIPTLSGKDFTGAFEVPTYSISGAVSGAPSEVTLNLSNGDQATTTGGIYTFSGLVQGNYTVTPVEIGGYTITPSAKDVTITNGNINAVNFAATPTAEGFKISGTVSGAASAPLEGVEVKVACKGVIKCSITTGADGNYSCPGLENDDYKVSASKSGFEFTPIPKTIAISGADKRQNFTGTVIPSSYIQLTEGVVKNYVQISAGGTAYYKAVIPAGTKKTEIRFTMGSKDYTTKQEMIIGKNNMVGESIYEYIVGLGLPQFSSGPDYYYAITSAKVYSTQFQHISGIAEGDVYYVFIKNVSNVKGSYSIVYVLY